MLEDICLCYGEPLIRHYGVSYKDKPKTKGTGDVVTLSRCLVAAG